MGGFTLVELVVTVAIVALLVGLASYTLLQGRRRMTLERANLTVKGLLEQARALASVAGSRAGTSRLVYGAGCTDAVALNPGNPASWQLWVRFDGTDLEVPSQLVDAGNDTVVVSCQRFVVSASTNNLGQFSFPVSPGALAFTPTGRILLAGLPGPYAYFQIENPADEKRYGVRVLPSGVTCVSSVEAGPPWCDQAR